MFTCQALDLDGNGRLQPLGEGIDGAQLSGRHRAQHVVVVGQLDPAQLQRALVSGSGSAPATGRPLGGRRER